MNNTPYIGTAPPSIKSAIARLALPVVVAFFALSVIAMIGGSAVAQEAGERTKLVKELNQRYAERPVAMGLTSSGGMVEVFSSADGSTWTMLLTMPDGQSRVIGDGESWFAVPAPTAGTKISMMAKDGES